MFGLQIHHLSPNSTDDDINHAVECINWFNENKGRKEENVRISKLLPECPCDISMARFDPWFWRIRTQLPFWRWWGWWGWNYQPKDIVCVDIAPAEMLWPYGKVGICT